MKHTKKFLFLLLLIFNILATNLFSFTNFINANENKEKHLAKKDFLEKIKKDEHFKEYENVMLSKNPKILNAIKDDKSNTIGYIAQYEIYIEKLKKIPLDYKNKPIIEIKTKTTSTLTFLYKFVDSSIDAIITDYSDLENEKITLIDLKKCNIETFNIKKEGALYKEALKLQNLKKDIIKDATDKLLLADYRSKCVWWMCTSYETVGGYIHESCEKYLGWACDGLSASGKLKLFGWAVCKAGSLIACYVPETKHCVSGYFETKFCPAGPDEY